MPGLDHPIMRLPKFAVLAAVLLGACNSGTGVPTATPSAASAAPTDARSPSSVVGGGVSITSILGGNYTPASTTWIRVSESAAPFSYEVPPTWTMHAANPWEEGGSVIGTALAAGVDPSRISVDFSIPGIVIGLSAISTEITPRQIVEDSGTFAGCSSNPVQEASEAGASVAFQLWTSCGGTGVLLVMAITTRREQGLLGIVFQGTSPDDLGYLDHIVGSIEATAAQTTPAPAATGGSVAGPTYTISMDVCQNQHGQGVSGGLIHNDDTLVHTYRIVVAFLDPNGVLLNDTGWTTSDLQPGVTARWQATVPSGLPAVSVSCQITRVELIS